MDDSGRRGRPPGRTMLADRRPARRNAAVAGRLDDWWDPAWDAAWWDPVWDPEGTQPVVATGTPVPAVAPDDAGAPAAAVQEGPAAVPLTSPAASAEPSWGQVLVTTIRLWVSRHRPRADAERPRPQAGAERPRSRKSARLLAPRRSGWRRS
jgi:hypothetical protein